MELKWNGQTMRVPLDQATKLAQQGYDYTQKTQALAEQVRQLEAMKAQMTQREAQWQQALSNPDLVRQHYESLLQSRGQSGDPNEVPTMAQMQQALRTEASRIQQHTQEQIQQAVDQAKTSIEVARLESDYTQSAETTLAAVKDAHPLLATIDDVEVLLRQDAWKILQTRAATTPDYVPSKDDVQKAIQQAAVARSAKLEAKIKDHEKAAVARQAKLTTQGIEPPGGKGVTPQASPKHKFGSKDLTQAAIDDVEAMMRASTQ
jgi:metal-dependent amidase/aminoacylase/carboxypeptidase family protein